MTEDHQQFEKSIKKKHSVRFTPKYEESTNTDLNKVVFIPIVVKTFEKLGWDLVFQDELFAEAKRKGTWDKWTEKITVTYDYGKVKVKSVSLGNEMWDNGRNSKRVKLFIHVFHETEQEFDRESLIELEEEVEKINNWDDYEIPEKLEQPKQRTEPKFWILVVGGLITSLLLGLIVAFLSVKGVYFIGLFEVGVAFAIGFVLSNLIKLSNYTHYKNLHYLLIGIILITYLSNQYFQYLIVLAENRHLQFTFFDFIAARFNSGLTIKELNTGSIGLLISWALQLVITYIVGLMRLTSGLMSYQIGKVPLEVVNFAFYHFVKEKTEDQVRAELSKMGWTEKQDQDDVFESIGAMQGASEFQRMD